MTSFAETVLEGEVQGVLLTPAAPSGLGVLVLGGSSGKIDVPRAALFASRGAHAIALQWFAGKDQIPGVCEVPLESFTPAIDRLQALGCTRIAIIGTSKGAEAALLVAIEDARVDVVIAVSPSSVVWANSGVGRDGAGWPLRSSFTRGGAPLPFVRYAVEHMPAQTDGPVSYLAYHHQSLAQFAADVPAAAIPIERARAHVILIGGGDDQLWPSARFAEELAARRREAGRSVDLITEPNAGHRILLPGETTPRSDINLHGGSDEADARCGARAWRAIAAALKFESEGA